MGYARVLQQARGEVGGQVAVIIGELVQLRSGGPVLTVQGVRADEWIEVVWLDKLGQAHESAFRPELLRRYKGNFLERVWG